MNCPKCNHEHINNAKYCTECGIALFKICDKCGAVTDIYSKFCPECGYYYPVLDLKVEYYKRKMLFYDDVFIANSSDGKYVLVKDRQKYKILNIKDLKPTIPYEFDDVDGITVLDDVCYIIAKKDGLWGIINPIRGQVICDFEYEDEKIVFYQDAYETDGSVLLKKRGKWGRVCGTTGDVILPFIYDEINALVLNYQKTLDLVKYNGFWGVINEGEQIVPFEYIKLGYKTVGRWDYLNDFGTDDEDIPLSQHKNGKWGIINIYNGEVILNPEFDEIKSYYNKDACFVKKNGRFGVVNKYNGKILLDCKYDSIEICSKSNDYKVRQEQKWGILNSMWEIVLECVYDEIEEKGRYFKLRKGDKFGIGSKKGEELPCEYDEIEEYYKYFKLRKGSKYGVCSKDEYRELLPCEYDEIFLKDFSSDITMRIGNKWGKVVYRRDPDSFPIPTLKRFDYDCIYSEDEIKEIR